MFRYYRRFPAIIQQGVAAVNDPEPGKQANVITKNPGVTPNSIGAERLSPEDSRKFAKLLKELMRECGLSSYSLYLEVDYPRSTLMRWLAGKTRIPKYAAMSLVKGLVARVERALNSSMLADLQMLLQAAHFADPGVSLLQTELRARGIPIQRTLDALRAARLLPSSIDQNAGDARAANQEHRSTQCQS